MFRLYDRDRSGEMDKEEVAIGFAKYGIELSEEEKQTVFAAFDVDGSGTVNMNEMCRFIRPPMSDSRVKLIEKAFAKMDKTGDGEITAADLRGVFNVKEHPKFKSGQWSEEKVLQEFLDTFQKDCETRDEKITREEFMDYYVGVSCEIDRDVYFDYMMRQAWKI